MHAQAIETMMRSDLDNMNKVHNGVLYGNDGIGLPGCIGRSQAQDSLNFQPQVCAHACMHARGPLLCTWPWGRRMFLKRARRHRSVFEHDRG